MAGFRVRLRRPAATSARDPFKAPTLSLSLYCSVCGDYRSSSRSYSFFRAAAVPSGIYRTPTPARTCAAFTPLATVSHGPAVRTARSYVQLTLVTTGSSAPRRLALNSSTSAASKPSTQTRPSSCPAAKASSPASTKPPMLAAHGSSSSPIPTRRDLGMRSASLSLGRPD